MCNRSHHALEANCSSVLKKTNHGKNQWILVYGAGQKLPKGRKYPQTNEHLMITATEVNIGVTNTSDDNDIHRKVFRLPKYPQKCARVSAGRHVCIHIRELVRE